MTGDGTRGVLFSTFRCEHDEGVDVRLSWSHDPVPLSIAPDNAERLQFRLSVLTPKESLKYVKDAVVTGGTCAPDNPAWYSSVGDILSQCGRPCPIMWRFGLDDYESAKANCVPLRKVLERDMKDPLPMPVTRALSDSCRALILKWMRDGMPKSSISAGYS